MSDAVPVKFVFGTNRHNKTRQVRRLRMGRPTYADVLNAIAGWVGGDRGARAATMYTDEDGDVITMGSEAEFRECLFLWRTRTLGSPDPLVIDVQVNREVPLPVMRGDAAEAPAPAAPAIDHARIRVDVQPLPAGAGIPPRAHLANTVAAVKRCIVVFYGEGILAKLLLGEVTPSRLGCDAWLSMPEAGGSSGSENACTSPRRCDAPIDVNVGQLYAAIVQRGLAAFEAAPTEALGLFDLAIALDPTAPTGYYNRACARLVVQDAGAESDDAAIAAALDDLEAAVARGYADGAHLAGDPDFVQLYGHPRFIALCVALNGDAGEEVAAAVAVEDVAIVPPAPEPATVAVAAAVAAVEAVVAPTPAAAEVRVPQDGDAVVAMAATPGAEAVPTAPVTAPEPVVGAVQEQGPSAAEVIAAATAGTPPPPAATAGDTDSEYTENLEDVQAGKEAEDAREGGEAAVSVADVPPRAPDADDDVDTDTDTDTLGDEGLEGGRALTDGFVEVPSGAGGVAGGDADDIAVEGREDDTEPTPVEGDAASDTSATSDFEMIDITVPVDGESVAVAVPVPDEATNNVGGEAEETGAAIMLSPPEGPPPADEAEAEANTAETYATHPHAAAITQLRAMGFLMDEQQVAVLEGHQGDVVATLQVLL